MRVTLAEEYYYALLESHHHYLTTTTARILQKQVIFFIPRVFSPRGDQNFFIIMDHNIMCSMDGARRVSE